MPVAPPAKDGVAAYVDEQVKDGLHLHKTLWAISPAYDGPVLLRGRRVDGNGRLFFVIVGAGKPKTELRIPAIPITSRHELPWAFIASLTGIPGPGCYAFQIDGLHFSDVVTFRAQENLP